MSTQTAAKTANLFGDCHDILELDEAYDRARVEFPDRPERVVADFTERRTELRAKVMLEVLRAA